MEKICPKCGLSKSTDEFHLFLGKPASWCKACKRAHVHQKAKTPSGLESRRRRVNAEVKRLRLEVIQRYGGKCVCCGEDHWRFLTIDHIDGNGAAHRREVSYGKGGHVFYRWLKRNNWPSGFRVLCWNCNASYGTHGWRIHQARVLATEVEA